MSHEQTVNAVVNPEHAVTVVCRQEGERPRYRYPLETVISIAD